MSEKITKRPLTAFMFFMKDYRENNKGNTTSIGQAAKDASVKWKAITGTQRKVFDDLAVIDKKRFETDLANGMVTSSKKTKKTANKKGSRKIKDPNAPKKAKTSYMCYLAEYRKSSTLTGPKLVSKAAEMWKQLSEKDKEMYVKLAGEDKKRYVEELEKYKKSAPPPPVAKAGKKTKPVKKTSNKSRNDDDDDNDNDESTDFEDSADEISDPNDSE